MAGPKKGSTTARGRSRRERILAVALESFAMNGYRGTSIASIAESVDLTEPGLLHHFPSKQRLLLAVIEHHEGRVGQRLKAVTAERSLADAFLDLAEQHEADPTFIRFFTTLAAESLNPEHPAHEWFLDRYERLRVGLASAIRSEQEAGRMRADLDAERVAELLLAILDGLELQHLLDGRVTITAPLRSFLSLTAATGAELKT